MKLTWVLGPILAAGGMPVMFGQSGGDIDFKISPAFLQQLASNNSVLTTLKVKLTHRTNRVHDLKGDCELHLAGKVLDNTVPGSPAAIVVEPPNLCKIPTPDGSKWEDLLDAKVMNQDCEATGFLRIFTEHASGSATAANPNHVFEIHPATSIRCGSQTVDFQPARFLKAFEGMRAIKPATTRSCVNNRELEVKFSGDQYAFRENNATCGNFAIVEVGFVEKDWIRTISNGHTAIARISPDGHSRASLKLYTVDGSEADQWLASIQASGLEEQRVLLHGMFTYDYFSVVKTLRTAPNKPFKKPPTYQRVDFPLAFVVFGKTNTVPWEDPDHDTDE